MKPFPVIAVFLTVFTVGLALVTFSGCATLQTPTTSAAQTLINDAWTAANDLQTANNNELITPAAQTAALSLTHNSDDAAYATVVTTLFNQIVGAQVAAQAAKVSPVTATNAVLAPDNVAAVATSVANGTVPAPAPATSGAPTTSVVAPPGGYIVRTGLRPIYGWNDPFNVQLATR
jgi:hypothetical protein